MEWTESGLSEVTRAKEGKLAEEEEGEGEEEVVVVQVVEEEPSSSVEEF